MNELTKVTLTNILAELDRLVSAPGYPEAPELDCLFDIVQSALAEMEK